MNNIGIIFEDNHLLVVEKPPGIPTQGDISGDEDLLSLLKRDIKERYNKPGNVFLGMVHRLDRPVGGVMVFAKTSKAASRLSDSIRKREFEKTYLAVIHGVPDPLSGTLRHFLQKNNKKNTVRAVPASSGKGMEAVLNYKTIGSSGNLSLVEVELITGRPHQVRVQFAGTGFPVYGDARYGLRHGLNHDLRSDLRSNLKGGLKSGLIDSLKNGLKDGLKDSHGDGLKDGLTVRLRGDLKSGLEYGRTDGRNESGIALWSHKLSFKHPTRDEIMTFRSYPPNQYPWTLFEI
jgi:23S rRNA pseudouridine1911/1915/1917 synthase